MFIDTHMHCMEGSEDSFIKLSEMVVQGKKMGLDAICITDHENNSVREFAMKYGKDNNFKIFVGAEILTFEGDIVVFGLHQLPKEKIHAQELIDMATSKGGVCIAVHPFRNNNRGCGFGIRELKGLAGIEGYNGSTKPHENLYAHALAMELGMACLGGSDCHEVETLGRYCTIFEDEIHTEADLIKAIKFGKVAPGVHKEGTYERIFAYGKKGQTY